MNFLRQILIDLITSLPWTKQRSLAVDKLLIRIEQQGDAHRLNIRPRKSDKRRDNGPIEIK